MVFSILFINKEKIIKVINTLIHFDASSKIPIKEKLVKFSFVLLIIVVVFVFDQYLANWFGYGKG